MKKGLRPAAWSVRSYGSNPRPDEEGIKTRLIVNLNQTREVQTHALMKKGLRQAPSLREQPGVQTHALMKKGLRPRSVVEVGNYVQTHALMKKGLRLVPQKCRCPFKPTP